MQERCLKACIRLELLTQASLIARGAGGTGLSGGTLSYLGWIAMDRLFSWAKVRGTPSIVEKGQESIFTCLSTLQARTHLPAPSNKILSSKECLSCVAGKIAGGAKLCVSCIPAKLGSFEKYIFRLLKEWIVPIFYKNPNSLSSMCQINLRKEPLLTTPQVIQVLLMQFPRRRLRSLTNSPQMATFQNNCCFVVVYEMIGKNLVQKYGFPSVILLRCNLLSPEHLNLRILEKILQIRKIFPHR